MHLHRWASLEGWATRAVALRGAQGRAPQRDGLSPRSLISARSFVQSAAKNAPESLAIIRAVVALADSLGMSTTAEGVETEEECKMINALGCRKIQGYLFGRPMPAAEARRIMAQDGSLRQAEAA